MVKIRHVIGELRRRKVLRTAGFYLVGSWLLLEVASTTAEPVGLPGWTMTFLVWSVIIGFPVAILLGWRYELGPDGLVRTQASAADDAHAELSLQYADYAILAAGVIIVGILTYQVVIRISDVPVSAEDVTARGPPAPNTIAVLPFFNIDGSDEMRIFSGGLAEDVINRLATVPGLRVSSRGDSFALTPNSSSDDVRNRLRVAYYLEGSVRRADETLRVVIQLIESENGFHIVSRSFDRELADFFEIQDEITSLIVANMRVAIPSLSELMIPVASDSASFDAYLQYRRGMEILYEPMTEETIEEALDVFDQSLAVDPEYAAAHAGICLTHTSGYDATSDPAYIDEAERSCASALGLNPNLIVVHNSLGVLYERTGRYEDAERAFERALMINENDVQALSGLADVYLSQQRLAEAEAKYRQAIGLQPGNWNTYSSLGRFLYLNGRYEDAANAYREIVAVDAENINGWTNLATSLMLSGDFAAAARAFERAIEMEPIPTTYVNLGMLHYYLGEADEAITAFEKAADMAPNDYLVWSNLGDVLAFSGDLDGAGQAFSTAEGLARGLLEVNSRDAETIIGLAWITAMLGRLDDAERFIARARDIVPTDPYVYFIDALVLTRIGNHDDAFDQLETAVEMGYPLALIRAEPHLEVLKGESRFERLIGD